MTFQQIIPVDGTRRDNNDTRAREAGAEQDESRVRESEREQVDTRDDAKAEAAGATPYLPEQDAGPANERWGHIQAKFVDDPRKAVSEAHELVGELTQRIVDAFARERSELERQWSEGENVSTEDLRVSLQRYRAFFSRLLPSVNKLDAD